MKFLFQLCKSAKHSAATLHGQVLDLRLQVITVAIYSWPNLI
jgi:hypothetical protein